MLSYCLKCKKNTECKNPKVVKTKTKRIMLLSKCVVCNSKKLTSFRAQQARGLLSSLGIRTSFSQIILLGRLFL